MIKLPCADCTIAERLKLLNASTFAFIIVLVVSNYGQLLSLEKKIITLQQFQGFVEDVLELRRYEKDFLLDVGSNNIEMIHKYLARITVTVERLDSQLKKLSSPEDYRTFIEAMQHYRICMKSSERGSIVSGECLHRYGRIMVEYATAVLEKKKAGLEINLKTILYTFTIVPATLVVLMIWGLFSQTRSVLNRIGDPFLQPRANAAERKGYEGMGLGVFIAKTLIERTGGRLTFSNGDAPFAPDAAAPARSGAVVEVVWPASRLLARDDAGLGLNQPIAV